MKRSAKPAMQVLQGRAGQLEVPAPMWVNFLLDAQDWGWRPAQMRLAYLASGAEITDDDARALAHSGERVFQAAVDNPGSLRLRTELLWVKLLGEFSAAGTFRAYIGAPPQTGHQE